MTKQPKQPAQPAQLAHPLNLWDTKPEVSLSAQIFTVKIGHYSQPTDQRAHITLSVSVEDRVAGIVRFNWFGVKYNPYSLKLSFDINKVGSLELVHDTRREIWDWLREWELIELKAVGPDDCEYFATDKLINPELNNLHNTTDFKTERVDKTDG